MAPWPHGPVAKHPVGNWPGLRTGRVAPEPGRLRWTGVGWQHGQSPIFERFAVRINADFSRPAVVAPAQHQWVASPQAGVERAMLDRVGAEKARATSLVRYAPESYFPAHDHPGGEEILVLSGTFSDGDGDYPAGWYLRNPPGSSHQPFSAQGATLFVKLWQMSASQSQAVRINTSDASCWQQGAHGRAVCPLYADATEQVCLQRWAAGDALPAPSNHGAELLVLEGAVEMHGQSFGPRSWIRWPPGADSDIRAAVHGATVYLKTGHLGTLVAGV